MMILQYTAAALASENKVLAHPASADSIPTSANQEDHVSMGATSAISQGATVLLVDPISSGVGASIENYAREIWHVPTTRS